MSQPCEHENFYWINRARGNYRCLDCGFQYHDRPPKRQPTAEEQFAVFQATVKP